MNTVPSYIQDTIKELSSIYRTIEPEHIYLDCTKLCVIGNTCNLKGCFRHYDRALCFREAEPARSLVAHEYGHLIFHYRNRIQPYGPNKDRINRCEEFASNLERWTISRYQESPKLFGEIEIPREVMASLLTILMGVITGVAVAALTELIRR